jgi:DNA-binding response OmpR family regulator
MMQLMKTIAIIDDDEYIGDMLEELLRKENYEVLRAYSGTEALLLLSQHRPDLVLLDLMLPGLSGEEVLTKIKDIPVIVISAKPDVEDKVKLLLGGAADYLTKPFDTKELLARIIVQLRIYKANDRRIITAGDLEIDTLSQQLSVEGVPVHLTKTEYAIIKLLIMNPSQVISKSAILDRISLDTPDCMESSLKVHMSNLRKKLRSVSDKEYIEVIWGIGYKLNEV